MLAYIIRRLLLVIPTLFGIMVVNFAIIQVAPGGPVERIIAEASTVSRQADTKLFQPSARIASARPSAAMAPMPAASIGVKKPP